MRQYRVDFDLGDIGTIRDEKLGGSLDYRITTVEEIYEGNQMRVSIVFGYDKSLLKDAIKRMNSKRDALLAVEESGNGSININSAEGVLAINKGGTGATTAAQALTNLGAAAATHTHTYSDVGAAAASHTHSAADVGAAPSTHYHTQYYETANFIYSRTQPTGTTKGQIWLKPTT